VPTGRYYFVQFTLGGPLRLGAYGVDQFRGDRIGYAGAGWLRRIGTLPAVLGGNLFLGGWYEAGGYSLAAQQTTWRQNGTVAFVAETPRAVLHRVQSWTRRAAVEWEVHIPCRAVFLRWPERASV
jgi:hypothetical protein